MFKTYKNLSKTYKIIQQPIKSYKNLLNTFYNAFTDVRWKATGHVLRKYSWQLMMKHLEIMYPTTPRYIWPNPKTAKTKQNQAKTSKTKQTQAKTSKTKQNQAKKATKQATTSKHKQKQKKNGPPKNC